VIIELEMYNMIIDRLVYIINGINDVFSYCEEYRGVVIILVYLLAITGWVIFYLLSKGIDHNEIFAKASENVKRSYENISNEDLITMYSSAINAISILGGIYGVMFALIISEKSNLIFISWSFFVWCCWVLAVLIMICHLISQSPNFHLYDRAKKEESLYLITSFIKNSGYILLLTTSYVPVFATLHTDNLDNMLKIWGGNIGPLLMMTSTIVLTFLIYRFLFDRRSIIAIGYTNIYFYLFMFLCLYGMYYVNVSPIEPVQSKWIGYFLDNRPLPSILVSLECYTITTPSLIPGLIITVYIFGKLGLIKE